MKVRTAGVVGVSALALLVGCSSETPKASGLVDGDTKHTAAVKAVAAKTHKTSKQEQKYKKECTRRVKGKCKATVKVPDGFKTVTVTVTDKPGKPYKAAKYCVQLDNVNGHKDDDDVWYNVSGTTYTAYKLKSEGNEIKDMEYNHEGC
jgi:hypothetical protein